MSDAVQTARRRTWRWVAWGLSLLPHALPMWWVISSAMSSSREIRGNTAYVILVEVPISVIVFAVASDLKGRGAWVRPVLRTATILGATAVVAAALLVSTTA